MSEADARAQELFLALRERPAHERELALAALARSDPALHSAVTMLFADAAERSDDGFGREPRSESAAADGIRTTDAATDVAADAGNDDRRAGAWRLDRAIAQGALSTVYEAHRADGHYQQRVALKRLRADLGSPQAIAAFRAQRQLLAQLDHPGIAELVDGGGDGDGRPWFAMRHVDGTAIDQWCDRQRLDTAARVDLLIALARILAYVHAQSRYHLDLRPANALVDDAGRVHLIGFGSAGGEPAAIAHAGGAAADLLALGALSYRLLCAHAPTPSADASAAPAPMHRLLAQAPADVAAARAEPDIAALARRLSGDLSAIALKAVAPSPQDRYPSVAEFADDLQRWREHRPVRARQVGAWTRLRMALRRHRVAVALAATLLLAAAAALGFSVWQSRLAASRAEATATVSGLFASTLGTATLAGLGTTPFSSQALLRRTETELRKLDLRRHPAVLAEGLAALARGQATVGDYPHAARLAEEAQRALGGDDDTNGYVAATYVSLLNVRARYGEAERLARQRIGALAAAPGEASARERITFSVELARAQWGMGDTAGALRTVDAALTLARGLRRDNAELIAQLLIERGTYRGRLLRNAQARSDLRIAVAMTERINPILSDDGLEQLIRIASRMSAAPDLVLAERLLQRRQDSLGERHPKTGRAWIMLGFFQLLNNRDVAARQRMLTGIELIEAAYGRKHPEYASALLPWSTAMAGAKRDNVDVLREALRICEATLGPRHESSLQARMALAALLQDLPPSQMRLEHHLEAERLFEENIAIKRQSGLPALYESAFLAHSLFKYRGREQIPRAVALLESVRAQAPLYYGPNDFLPLFANLLWTEVRYLEGNRAEADREFAHLIEVRFGRPGLNSSMTVHTSLMYRALYALETCRRADAEALLSRALQSDLDTLGPTHFASADARGYLNSVRKHGLMLNTTGAQAIPAYELKDANRRAAACARSR